MSMQVEEVSDMKAEAETMVGRMQSTMMEEMGLKEEKVSRYAMDWHELPLLIADKLVPPGREGSKAEAQAPAIGSMKVVEFDEVEKDWQGGVLLAIEKQDLEEVSVSKKLKTRLMHALKAEAVQVEECEQEGYEAPQLLIDKQAAAAG